MEEDIVFKPVIDDSDFAKQSQKLQEDLEDAFDTEEVGGKWKAFLGKLALWFAGLKGLGKILEVAFDYMGRLLKTNKDFVAESKKISGALATAFQPLYEVAVPALLTVLRLITAIVTMAAKITNFLFGKRASQSAANAKALNAQADALNNVGGAAKNATKQLAGFDEINRLEDNSSSGGGGGAQNGVGMDFSQFDALHDKMTGLEMALSGCLLALGAILAFSGVNIPLGIGLMVAGALGLAEAVAENWDSLREKIQGPLGTILRDLSMGLLVIGAVLAFSGTNIPLGIALMAAGGAGLATYTALNWNSIKERLQEVWRGIEDWWNTTVQPVIDSWREKISSIFSFGSIKRFFGGGGGSALPSGFDVSQIRSVPPLANGAVIPPNAPFLAMLGDQGHGNNLEAPESLIRQIVREEAGNNSDVVEMLSQLIDAVRGIRVGDDVIGRAAARYTRSTSRATGR